jgi:hypothetical protein
VSIIDRIGIRRVAVERATVISEQSFAAVLGNGTLRHGRGAPQGAVRPRPEERSPCHRQPSDHEGKGQSLLNRKKHAFYVGVENRIENSSLIAPKAA